MISNNIKSCLLFCRIRMLLNPDTSQVTNQLVACNPTLTDVQGLIVSSLSTRAIGQSGSSGYMRLETDDLAGHRKVATHINTTPGPSSPIISVLLSILINLCISSTAILLGQFGKKKIVKCMLFSESVVREMAVVSYITIGSTICSLLSCLYHC